MSGVKTALKAAKSALDAQNYVEAAIQANTVLSSDPHSYFGNVFLGRALEKQNKVYPAIDAYKNATKIKPDDELAWKGLCNAYVSLGPSGIDGHTLAAMGLAQAYAEKDDKDQCQTTVDNLVSFAKAQGTRQEYKRALQCYLPTSPIYDFLEGRIPSPSFVYTRMAEITEFAEKERINKEIGERRTRLGARLGQVTLEVTREVFAKSDLEALYESIIDWSTDDEIRRSYEEKLLERAYDHLVALQADEKAQKRAQVMKLAHDMVIIKHPYKLAWRVEFEWSDVQDLAQLDRGVIVDYTGFFADSGLSKIFQGYLGLVPADESNHGQADGDAGVQSVKHEKLKPLSTEDRLVLLVDGLDDEKDSAFAHRIVSDFYLHLEEYESCSETCRSGRMLLMAESQKSGLSLQHALDAINSNLATSLVYYQSPKNHPEARDLFNDILIRRPESTAALLGVGLIFEEEEEYEKATAFLDRALLRDPENIRIGTEAAWCKVLNGDVSIGFQQLQGYLVKIVAERAPLADLKAQISYRVGKCLWDLHTDKASRRSRDGAYAHFIMALKANPTYSPPYTSLGIYYADYARDRKRARQCFQKAFELSASEVLAAERLAKDFANDKDWDLVEIVAQRVIDSGIVRPSPGSKRKGISWPFAAMGVVQMNKQEYSSSVVSFQAALRISGADYNSWIGLGESYHSSGRYIAAQRALEHAQTFKAIDGATGKSGDAWFAQYMLANVFRELGDYTQALSNYQQVLVLRHNEFGVSIAYLQTLVEQSSHNIETGFYGQAAESARHALVFAEGISESHDRTFNFWKAIGDACAVFSQIPSHGKQFPNSNISALLLSADDSRTPVLAELDAITNDGVRALLSQSGSSSSRSASTSLSLSCALLAYKQALHVSSNDVHAQAVAWYNLGLAEWRIHVCFKKETLNLSDAKVAKFANAAVRCFKRSIELEAGNADFWNALGVITTHLNPKVAQHSFVRSLHLNERSARTWTNLGSLYLLQNDHELAHSAFARAQSTDPDYAHAWVGEGLIALLTGDKGEALSHFTHAVEIADASCVFVKAQYVTSAFGKIASNSNVSHELADLIQPIFALQQLQTQAVDATAYHHILGLLHERVGDYRAAVENLLIVCEVKEAQYEETEDAVTLGEFTKARTDLARNQLAIGNNEDAAESAETVLGLSAEEDPAVFHSSERQKLRLSAHLTAGLAQYKLGLFDEALEMFRAALEESNSAPSVVCLLSQVLWAKGGGEERNVAKDQLFECVDQHTGGNFGATILLGAMSAMDGDESTREAVMADLQMTRGGDGLDASQKWQAETLHAKLLASTSVGEEGALQNIAEAATSIMISPSQPLGWTTLADLTTDGHAAQMVIKTAKMSVPPHGSLDSGGLSRAFAGTGSAGDAQKSIALCPWKMEGWESLQLCLARSSQSGIDITTFES